MVVNDYLSFCDDYVINYPDVKFAVRVVNQDGSSVFCPNNYKFKFGAKSFVENYRGLFAVDYYFIDKYSWFYNQNAKYVLLEYEEDNVNYRYEGRDIMNVEGKQEIALSKGNIIGIFDSVEHVKKFSKQSIDNFSKIKAELFKDKYGELYYFSDLVEFAKKRYYEGDIHGITHAKNVERYGLRLSYEMKNTNVNKQIVRLFAYLHDIGRVSNGTEPIHGEKACGILREFKRKLYLNTLKDDDFDKLCTAISVHNKVRKTGDLTIDLCLDADRLDLSRVGIKPNPKMMATEIGEYFAEHLHLLHPNWW